MECLVQMVLLQCQSNNLARWESLQALHMDDGDYHAMSRGKCQHSVSAVSVQCQCQCQCVIPAAQLGRFSHITLQRVPSCQVANAPNPQSCTAVTRESSSDSRVSRQRSSDPAIQAAARGPLRPGHKFTTPLPMLWAPMPPSQVLGWPCKQLQFLCKLAALPLYSQSVGPLNPVRGFSVVRGPEEAALPLSHTTPLLSPTFTSQSPPLAPTHKAEGFCVALEAALGPFYFIACPCHWTDA